MRRMPCKREAEKKHDAAVRARWAAAAVNSRGMDSKTNRMEDAEGIAIAAVAQEKKEAREEQSKAAEEKQQATAAAQQQALKDFRAGEVASYAVTPKVEEKKLWWGSLVDAGKGLWNAGTSVLVGLASSAKSTGGGSKPLYAHARQDEDPPPPEKDDYWYQPFVDAWNWIISVPSKISSLFTSNPASTPIATTPNAVSTMAAQFMQTITSMTQTAMPTAITTPMIAPTNILSPTATSTPVRSIYSINGPMTVDQIPLEFKCTLNPQSDYHYRCGVGEKLMQGILTDEKGWWWNDGENRGVNWNGIKTNEDVWKFALTYGFDAEATNLRINDKVWENNVATAIRNKFWHFDHGVYPSYNNVFDYSAEPLGHNGRLIALGSLQSIQLRVDGEGGFVEPHKPVKPASASFAIPLDGYNTVQWESAEKIVNDFIWPEPNWICPNPKEPYEYANADIMKDTPPTILTVPKGNNFDQVLYRTSEGGHLYVLTLEQNQFFHEFKYYTDEKYN